MTTQDPKQPAAPMTSAAPGASAQAGLRDRGARRTGLLKRAAGVTAGLVILAAAAAGLAAAETVEGPQAAVPLPAVSAAVPAGDRVQICPEPARLLAGSGEGTDPDFSPVSASAQTTVDGLVFSDLAGTVPGSTLTELGAAAPLKVIAEPVPEAVKTAAPPSNNDAGLTTELAAVLTGQPVQRETVLRAEPLGLGQSFGGALMSYTATDGDLRGYAAAQCQTPGHEQWLVGASTTVGSTAVLKLTNASPTPSTVDLELIGAAGRLQAAGSRGLLVPPGHTKSIVLAGLAANQEVLAVHVSASGGPVSALIQQSTLRGLTPGGVDLIQPSTVPATGQVLTGVSIQAAAGPVGAQPGYASATPALQVAVPGGDDALLEVKVFGANGQTELTGGGVVTAAAGSMTSVPLGSLPEGNYTVEISSSVPVVAAARLIRATAPGEPVDIAWTPSGDRLGNQHLVVLPRSMDSTLVFGATAGPGTVELRPVEADGRIGAARRLEVPAGTTVSAAAKSYGGNIVGLLVSGTGEPLYGAQVLIGGGAQLAAVPLAAAASGQQSIPVNLGY